MFSVEIHNALDRAVRIASASWTFLRDGTPLERRDPGAAFFSSATLPLPDRIDRDGRVTWSGICLDDVPAGADSVRLDLALAARRSLREEKGAASLVVPLAAPPPVPALRLPFEGHWRVTQGHACGTNHRLGGRGQDFAWDFRAVGHASPQGSFGKEVAAPVGGRVVKVVDDTPDNEPRKEPVRRSFLEDSRRKDWVFGNYVVLEASGVYVLLGHLQHGSVVVAPGAVVRAGDPLAHAGNSGNSMDSHLHLQVMDRADPADPDVRGVPALMTTYVEFRAAGPESSREVLVRRVTAGDPPEGVVITPDRETPR